MKGSPKRSPSRPMVLFLLLLIVGIGLIAFSRWFLFEFGRVVYGGSEARPLAVDSTLLGVGGSIALIAVIGAGFSLMVSARFSRAMRAAGPAGIAFPAERISRALLPPGLDVAGDESPLIRLPYYMSVSLSDSALTLWGDGEKPIGQVDLRRVRKVGLSREAPPSQRRVLTISLEEGTPDFLLSVMSDRWLLLPETRESAATAITAAISRQPRGIDYEAPPE